MSEPDFVLKESGVIVPVTPRARQWVLRYERKLGLRLCAGGVRVTHENAVEIVHALKSERLTIEHEPAG